jgi:murein DD-endopeptidase MepM/ murein hydrolase activator NlpD
MECVQRRKIRDLTAIAVLSLAGLAGCGGGEALVWPVSGEGASDFPLSSTFGPRLRTDDLIYDFHRGIDIAVPFDTDIYAIAAGRVVQIQENTSAGGMLVQIEHPGPYFSNYIHLSDVDVDIGDSVDAGEDIGDSGRATNGFEHLHFEIRRPGDAKTDCIHPLSVLPYEDSGAPKLTIDSVNIENPMAPIVNVTASVPARELDLKRITVATFEGPESTTPLSEQTFDVDDWNRTYTEIDSDTLIDTPSIDGIALSPQKYNSTIGAFTMSLTFSKLVGPGAQGPRVKATATDVHGNTVEVLSP